MIVAVKGAIISALVFVGVATLPSMCGAARPETAAIKREAPAAIVSLKTIEAHGIRVECVRLSAARYMVELSYRVLDPDKASHVMKGFASPYLIDRIHDRRLMTSDSVNSALVKPSGRLMTGRVYIALFSNPERLLKAGDRVTIVMGAVQIPDVPVE